MFGVGDHRVIAAVRAYVKLNRATRTVLAAVEPRLAEAGLTPTQLGVLEAVLHRGPMTQAELGRKVLTSAGNMTDVIDKLAARGLVARQPNATDRRSVHVALTPAGCGLIEGLFPSHAEDIGRVFACLTPAELAEFDRLLRKLGLGANTLELGNTPAQMPPR